MSRSRPAWVWRPASFAGAAPWRIWTTMACRIFFYATGSVYPELEPFRTQAVLYRNLGGGRFEEMLDEGGPGIAENHASRGVAFGDFDNDGDLDILVANINEPPSLLRNDVTGRRPTGSRCNSKARSRTAAPSGPQSSPRTAAANRPRRVMAQSSYLSVNDRRLHFGLGEAATADLEIRWPSGAVEKLAGVPCRPAHGDSRRHRHREDAALRPLAPSNLRRRFRGRIGPCCHWFT